MTETLMLQALPMAAAGIEYPPARRTDQVDDYHGTAVPDPYRWLEDSDSPETRAWIEAENRLTFDILAGIPAREQLRQRLTRLWDFEKFSIPFKEGGRYFYFHNTGLQNQSVFYTTPSLDAEPRVLLDPNALSPDGTVAFSGLGVSRDGKLAAYALSSAGSDWMEWRVRDVESGSDLPDFLQWSKFSGASWTHDHQGFFYARFPAPVPGEELQEANYGHTIYYHRLGTPQEEDPLIYERPDHKDWYLGASVTEDGRYLLLDLSPGTDPKNGVAYKELGDPARPAVGDEAPVVELFHPGDAEYSFVGNEGPLFWFVTNKNAPRRRLVAVDTRHPEPAGWQEVIPEAPETLQWVSLVGERFIATYLKDAQTQIRVYRLDGSFEREVDLPGVGTAGGFGGKRHETETFYGFTSFTVPHTIYRYDVATGQSTLFRRPQVEFQPEDFETHQVFYESKDGTRVPLFLVHKKGLQRDGRNPVYLYGYGGFNAAMVPAFSTATVAWLERGGVFAQACLRGGGEYGEEWHEAGRRANKQNVFDDFIAAAEWLIRERYTSPDRLAIGGGSNGGLLVGACMTQRPELFGAVLAAVGVMDMLRYHKFTVGWGWIPEYGSPDEPEEFRVLQAYSPLHNIRPGTCYPATLITTGDHDDRVAPAHSFKFAAALQAAQGCDRPVLIRIETRAGHGAGKPTAKVIEEAADRWAFLVKALGM